MRVRTQIGQVQAHELVAPEPEPIGRLDHRRVAPRGKRPFPAEAHDLLNPCIEPVEEILQLPIRQRATLRSALVLVQVRDRNVAL